MPEPLIFSIGFQNLGKNKLQHHPGRPLLSPTHSPRISPLSYCDIAQLLTLQIPQDWLGLQIKHCLCIVKLISYNTKYTQCR